MVGGEIAHGAADYLAREKAQAAQAQLETLKQVLLERERNDERRWAERDRADETWRASTQSLVGEMQRAHQIAISDLRNSTDNKIESAKKDAKDEVAGARREAKDELGAHQQEDDRLFGIINNRFWIVGGSVIALLVTICLSLLGVIYVKMGN